VRARVSPLGVLCFAFLVTAAAGAAAADRSLFVTDVQPHIIGVDVGLGYRGWPLVPGLDTTVWAYLGASYEWESYYRDGAGNLLAPGALAAPGSPDPGYNRIQGAWRLGLDQGLAANARTAGDLVSVFAYYRGRVDVNRYAAGSLLSASTLPDRDGLLLNTLQLGISWDDVLVNRQHKTSDGISAELSAEWAPRFFFNTLFGDSDYLRLNANLAWYLPLYDAAPDRPVNMLAVYLAEFLSVDYAVGFASPVPLTVRHTFGGRNQLDGLGGQVRGVDTDSLDTTFKVVNNLEVRANLQPLVLPDIVPGILAFWDTGFYDQVGEPGVASPQSGFVSSVGIGAFLDFLDLGSGAIYMTFRTDHANANGQIVGATIEFGMHF
jgi:hypothetical protein